MPRVLLISAVLVVSACGGGGESSSPTPAPVPTAPTPVPAPTPSPSSSTVCGSAFLGNATAVYSSANCTTCTNTTPEKAIDNNDSTAAQIDLSGGGGVVTLRATTQSGTVVAAGHKAGALIQFPAGATTSTSLNFTTYLDGQMQESVVGSSSTGSPTTTSTPNFYRFANSKPYNRIDVTIDERGVASNSPTKVIEICSE